jgi:CheY-like chemotaxis protein
MDVQMPEMDGLESTRLIREAERRRGSRRTPIVALTAHVFPVQHAQCLAEGMDRVVTKPVNLSALVEAVGSVLPTRPVGPAPPSPVFPG